MESNTKTKKKPFKQTRELIRLAINNGWTQKEIADKCRTQQSVVSAWYRGEKLATEQQLKPLLDLFGHKLRRNTFRLYWGVDDKDEKIFIKVEGKIIFSLIFQEKSSFSSQQPYKVIIHYQGNNKFFLIWQHKISTKDFNNLEGALWQTIFIKSFLLNELIDYFEEISICEFSQDLNKYSEHLSALPFLIRQALLNHGFSIDGLTEYPASW
ncbi:transcriptional regulator [Conchiformibius steedae DSM 2580]|uniref:Transcriptional regulator n=1 Tax=Conchiformibius steedae DSM 2580 TaxID=1121352 RepID=A0AAE9KYG6_9NEIS|nr:transcriptional regulator [Conchiformibius steedae]QMT33944.1 transcriptional regulator [Conchiformibius steedae]URD66713.1 transcriptional regulator [Conchiformibius steedae DSM 2580]